MIWDFFQFHGRDEALAGKPQVDFDLRRRGIAVALGFGECRLALERLALELRPQVDEACLRGRHGGIGVQRRLFEFRVAQDQDNRVRLDGGPRVNHDPFHASVRARRDPADFLGHEGPEAPHLAHHWPAPHGIGPDGGFLQCRDRGLQPRKSHRYPCQRQHPGRARDPTADLAELCDAG